MDFYEHLGLADAKPFDWLAIKVGDRVITKKGGVLFVSSVAAYAESLNLGLIGHGSQRFFKSGLRMNTDTVSDLVGYIPKKFNWDTDLKVGMVLKGRNNTTAELIKQVDSNSTDKWMLLITYADGTKSAMLVATYWLKFNYEEPSSF